MKPFLNGRSNLFCFFLLTWLECLFSHRWSRERDCTQPNHSTGKPRTAVPSLPSLVILTQTSTRKWVSHQFKQQLQANKVVTVVGTSNVKGMRMESWFSLCRCYDHNTVVNSSARFCKLFSQQLHTKSVVALAGDCADVPRRARIRKLGRWIQKKPNRKSLKCLRSCENQIDRIEDRTSLPCISPSLKIKRKLDSWSRMRKPKNKPIKTLVSNHCDTLLLTFLSWLRQRSFH